jgi:phosphohistidine phosphatase
MIYLLHHADALSPDIDAQRPLSDTGRAHAERLASQFSSRGVKLAAIWHSGKLRARQTAEPFRRLCSPLAEFAAIRGLQPDDPPDWIRDKLIGESRDVMLVGHMPSLPRLLHLLVGGTSESPSSDFPLHGLVALERTDSTWTERWRLI